MTVQDWASISLVVLAAEGLIVAVIEGVVLYFLIRGIIALNRKLCLLFPKIQGQVRTAAAITSRASHRIAAPFVTLSSAVASVRQMQRAVVNPPDGRGRV